MLAKFLNVRTYVKYNGEAGIYFIREWLPNHLAVHIGPWAFGLPYQFGSMCYDHHHERGVIKGKVQGGGGLLTYQAMLSHHCYDSVDEGGLEEFLLERYTAFTRGCGFKRYFRVWHEPWKQVGIEVDVQDNSLLSRAPGGMGWAEDARLTGAHYTPGAKGVWMGRPHFIYGDQKQRKKEEP